MINSSNVGDLLALFKLWHWYYDVFIRSETSEINSNFTGTSGNRDHTLCWSSRTHQEGQLLQFLVALIELFKEMVSPNIGNWNRTSKSRTKKDCLMWTCVTKQSIIRWQLEPVAVEIGPQYKDISNVEDSSRYSETRKQKDRAVLD